VKLTGWIGVVLAVLVGLLGLEADGRPYLLVLGWSVIGLGYWVWRSERFAGRGRGAT
jgi:APA family basic amino acid/polyamine antiporter